MAFKETGQVSSGGKGNLMGGAPSGSKMSELRPMQEAPMGSVSLGTPFTSGGNSAGSASVPTRNVPTQR